MQESDLKKVSGLEDLTILDENDSAAIPVTSARSALQIAEADTMERLQELLHRDEYRVLFGVRFQGEGTETIRVYFELLNDA